MDHDESPVRRGVRPGAARGRADARTDEREVLERLLAQPAGEDRALLARLLDDAVAAPPAGYAAPVLRPQSKAACSPAPRLWPAGRLVAGPLQLAGVALLAGAVAFGGSAPVAGAVPARHPAATASRAPAPPAGRLAAAALSQAASARGLRPARAVAAAPRLAPVAIPAFELAAAPPVAPAAGPAAAPLAAPPAAIPQYAVVQLPAVSLAAQVPPPPPPQPVEIYNPVPVEIYNPQPAPARPAARPAPRPQPARPAPRPSSAYPVQGARYVVQRGDYLRLISTWSYGTERLWPVIYDSNLRVIGANPDLIYPGQVLGIPTVSGRPQPGAPAGRRYTVRAGDTLASIALRVYGDAGRWPQLYRANVAAIGAAPGLIFPGTVLALP